MTGSLIVLGATGCVGRAVVAAAVTAGRPVIAVARDADPLAALVASHPGHDIVTLAASIASDGDSAALAARLQQLDRPVSGAVAAICGDVERGRLLDQPADFLRRRLDEDLLPHLFAARHLLPLLATHADQGRRGGYVLIGGPGADQPWAGYGHRSIGAAALRMLARVLHEEARAYPLRVQLLSVDSPLRTDANARHACSAWPHVASIARRALAMADGRSPQIDAVVRCPSRDAAPGDGADDLDAGASGSDIGIARHASLPASTYAGAQPSTHRQRVMQPHARAQQTDSKRDAVAQSSITDARALLRAIAAAPRLQETPSS